MKKILFCFLMTSLIIGTVNLSAGASTMTVGASTWLTWMDTTGGISSAAPDKPFFMTGPVFAIGINQQFSFSSMVLAGTFNMAGMTAIRVDNDNALSCKLSKYFKLVTGIKVTHYELDNGTNKIKITNFGPVLGTSFTYSLRKNLFLLASFSAMFTPNINHGSGGTNEWNYVVGQNSSLSIGYLFESINTIISLGGRYQCWATSQTDFKAWEHFSGLTFTAVYTFDI